MTIGGFAYYIELYNAILYLYLYLYYHKNRSHHGAYRLKINNDIGHTKTKTPESYFSMPTGSLFTLYNFVKQVNIKVVYRENWHSKI